MEPRTVLTAAVVVVVALQRLAELALARHWLRRTAAEGSAAPQPEPAYALMVAVHMAWLAGCAVEPLAWPQSWLPGLGWPMAVVWVGALVLRVWTLATLGRYWHVRIVERAAQPVITGGPYRWLRHPNYLVVILEIAAVPLLLGAYVTAAAGSLANAAVLVARIRREEAYLLAQPAYRAAFAHKARLLPGVF